MKNTMKMKSLLSFFVPAAMMSLMVASCSDYDNGYDTNAIKFNEEFRKAYGDIDPEQDWNLAERGTVTVSTMKESEVKIYALRGNEYVLVGDYEGVKGTKMLGFDMVEGTNSIMVTDGATAEKTVPGGVVTFGGTRNVIEGTTGDVKVTKLTSEVTIGVETFPAYRTSNMAEVDKVLNEIVPQGEDNIQKVTSDFTYVSTGSFIIYPFYWYTSSENTIGVYYTDANDVYHEVDIYESKGSQHGANNTGELWYLMDDQVLTDDLEGWEKSNVSNVQGWTSGNLQKPEEVKNDQKDPSGIVAPFVEYWAGTALGNATISKTFTVSPNVECLVEVAARLRNQNGTSTSGLGTVTFTANNQSVELTANGNYSAGTYTYYDENSGTQKTQGNLYSNMNGTGKIMVKCKADSNGKINVSFNLNNVGFNWFSFKDLKIANLDAMTAMGNSEFPGYNSDPNSLPGDMSDDVLAHFFKGQGIRVDIEPGTKFGMYLKKTDGSGSYKFYSESSKNVADTRLHDKYCYASTFYNGDQMFIGLEDWPNGDSDLNDLVLAFSGAKPIIINEEAESWLMVCEDLGGSFDTDYNDVIFKVDHVSGKETAKVTAMAAGGTLASYIVLNNPGSSPLVVGEIHQMLGAAPEKSGAYTPINATSRYEAVGSEVEIPVPSNFTMAYSTEVDQAGVNMGGFEIYTLNSGEESAPTNATVNDLSNSQVSVIAAPDPGSAPYMLCLPYTYTKEEDGKINTYVWAWPQELCTICSATYNNGKYSGSNGGAYLEFGAWVSSYSDNRDWYKNPNNNASIVETLLLKSENIQSGELQIRESLVLADGPHAAVDLSQNVIPAAGGGEVTYNILSLNRSATIPNVGSSYTFTNGAGIVQVIQNGVTKEFTVKFKSPLSNKGNMTVHKANAGTGISVDLASNLINANVSKGALSYEYGHSGGDHNSPTQPLYSKGPRTITVTQDADDNYVAGTTTFTLNIINDDEGGILAYSKQQMTVAADGNDAYTYSYKFVVDKSAFASYNGAITLTITGTGEARSSCYYIDQKYDSNYFNPEGNSNNIVTISLSAEQVNAAKQYGFVFMAGNADITIAVE